MKTTSILAYLSLAVFCASTAQATPVQWSSGLGGNDHWYEAVEVPALLNWSDANTAATNAGGYLATLTSAAENTFVFNLINNFPLYWRNSSSASLGPWIGGFQPAGSAEPGGGWSWVIGETFSYNNWAFNEPNNNVGASGGNEDSIHFFREGTNNTAATWNDIAGAGFFPLRAYVVEFNSIPEPHSLTLLGLGLAVLGLTMRPRARIERS